MLRLKKQTGILIQQKIGNDSNTNNLNKFKKCFFSCQSEFNHSKEDFINSSEICFVETPALS
jgi:hypothetical protein